MTPAFVMLSHESRADSYRKESLAQLAAAGITPIVIESTATSGTDAEVRRRAYDALEHATAAGLVFLEDDIHVRSSLFLRHVAMAIDAQAVTVFCAVNQRHYPPGTLFQPSLIASLAPMPAYDDNRGYHGSMAVYLPPALVAHGLTHPHEFMRADGSPLTTPVITPDHQRGKVTGFDFWIKHHARAFGGILVALPNSVDHVGLSVRNNQRASPWRSPSFLIPEA